MTCLYMIIIIIEDLISIFHGHMFYLDSIVMVTKKKKRKGKMLITKYVYDFTKQILYFLRSVGRSEEN